MSDPAIDALTAAAVAYQDAVEKSERASNLVEKARAYLAETNDADSIAHAEFRTAREVLLATAKQLA